MHNVKEHNLNGDAMLAIIVKGKKLEIQQALQRSYPKKSLFEFRLDLMERQALKGLSGLQQQAQLPIIFTLRCIRQGGQFAGSEEERLNFLFSCLSLKVDYVDLEYDIDPAFARKVKTTFPNTKIICSFHDFEKTPNDLDQVLEKIQLFPADMYKICTYAKSSVDSLRMLEFIQRTRTQRQPVAGMCIGPLGAVTRILARVVDNVVTYIPAGKEDDLTHGGLNLDDLLNIYHYEYLDKQTAIYALLGDPVESSIGHLIRNEIFRVLNIPAVYVKLKVKKSELPELFFLIKKLPFKGFSVTMPLKEDVGNFMDKIEKKASEVGAINTIGLKNGKWVGYNTDAVGLIAAIEKKIAIEKKRFLIFGAGGAAKAAAVAISQRGGEVIIVNRDEIKAHTLAEKVDGRGFGFDALPTLFKEGYDLLINATSVGMAPNIQECIVDPKYLIKGKIVFDFVYKPTETVLIRKAKKAGSKVIYGVELYAYQAIGQLQICFGKNLDQERIFKKIVDFNRSLERA